MNEIPSAILMFLCCVFNEGGGCVYLCVCLFSSLALNLLCYLILFYCVLVVFVYVWISYCFSDWLW